MVSKKVQKVLNDQINEEMGSAYLYFSMSNWFHTQNLHGFAGWLQHQAKEEMEHGLKIYGYLHNQNSSAELKTLNAPQKTWKSPLAAFQDTYKHEQHITGLINNIADVAIAEKDHATNVFINWFVGEQVEEEAAALAVLEKLKMVGDHPGGVYFLDREMGARA